MAKRNRKVKKPSAASRKLRQGRPGNTVRQARPPSYLSDTPRADPGVMPELSRELAVAPLGIGDDGKQALYIPAPAFARVLDVADREKLELKVGVGRERFDLDKRVGLAGLMRAVAEGTDFVRTAVDVPLIGGGSWGGWVDLPTRYVGMMIEAARHRDDERPAASKVTVTQPWEIRPRWQGSHVFDKVWDAAMERNVAPESGNREPSGAITTGPGKILAVEMLQLLRECHLVRVEAAQIEVLPDWEDVAQAFDYAADLHLPFDPLLLEFEGLGGLAPLVRIPVDDPPNGGVVAMLRGAVVQARPALIGGDANEIIVQPFGTLVGVHEGALYDALHPGEDVVHPYVPMGRMMFGADTSGGRPLVGAQEIEVATAQGREDRLRAEAAAVNASVFVDSELRALALSDARAPSAFGPLGQPVNGVVVLPYEASLVGADGDAITVEATVDWAAIVFCLSLKVLAALSIMESDVVVVEETQLEKRDRDRAIKRGWKIADEVYVRPVRKGKKHEATPGHEREYSHQFWVRGHTKHYPVGTRMADARPDLVKTCTRGGEASCGMCRRIWTPPFVKGPDDKPLVVKSLVKRVERRPAA